jgi:hypothetical protein
MEHIKTLFLLSFFLIFSSFDDSDFVFYKNDKIILSSKRGGVNMNVLFNEFDKQERLKVAYYVFTEPKKLIGTEEITRNKELISNYIAKYKIKAHQANSKKHDIEYDEMDFKIVHEIRNNKMFFYYYHSKINSSTTFIKTDNAKNKENYSWLFIGVNDFLMDIYINDELVLSKYFGLKI